MLFKMSDVSVGRNSDKAPSENLERYDPSYPGSSFKETWKSDENSEGYPVASYHLRSSFRERWKSDEAKSENLERYDPKERRKSVETKSDESKSENSERYDPSYHPGSSFKERYVCS